MRPPPLALLDPAGYRRTPWKNGGGVTIDIAFAYREGCEPGGWEGMLWRFGRTRIELPGPFSDLSGYERLLGVIEGKGLTLRRASGATLDATQPFRPVRFDGGWPIQSELSDGGVGVLNLMADRARYAIDLAFPDPGSTTTAASGVVLVWAVGRSELSIDDAIVELNDDWCCRLDANEAVRIVCRRGRVAVASISARR